MHARVNEFIRARQDSKMSKEGKRTKGGHTLRDTLFAVTNGRRKKSSTSLKKNTNFGERFTGTTVISEASSVETFNTLRSKKKCDKNTLSCVVHTSFVAACSTSSTRTTRRPAKLSDYM